MNELIEKLKDKNYVRAFGLMTPEEQECFRKAEKKNCLWYHGNGKICWSGNTLSINTFDPQTTYAIKRDYQLEPETEFVDIEIKKRDSQLNEWLGIFDKDSPFELPHHFTHLHCLPSLPNFEKFFYAQGVTEHHISFECIANIISQFTKVYARFRK